MKLIHQNPFRIIGVAANATERELLSRKNKIAAFARVGKQISSEYDFSFLHSITQDEQLINKAFSDIEQNRNKVNHSLFWFVNINPKDNTAIQYLIEDNKEKAIEIWEKVIGNKEISTQNFSAYNNLGTLYLLSKNPSYLKNGITSKIELIESDNFHDFVYEITDLSFRPNETEQVQFFIDRVLEELKGEYSITQVVDMFSDCKESTKDYLLSKLSEEPSHFIENQIQQTENHRVENALNAYQFGDSLYRNTEKELVLLKSLLGENNLQYNLLADSVAKEISKCSIAYFNISQDQDSTKDYLDEAMKLARLAQKVAVNPSTINKLKKDIEILEEIKDKDIDMLISILNSILATYQEVYDEIIISAKKELGIYEEKEFIIIGDKKYELPKSRPVYNPFETRTIDYFAVKEAARNSINKEAALNAIKPYVTDQKLREIAKSAKDEKVKELYKLLKKINDDILDINLASIENVLFDSLPKSSTVYQQILKKKERLAEIERIEEEKKKEKELEKLKEDQEKQSKSEKKWAIAIGAVIALFFIIGIIWGRDGIHTAFVITGVIAFGLIVGLITDR